MYSLINYHFSIIWRKNTTLILLFRAIFIDPQPRSNTAKGGKMMDKRTRRKDIYEKTVICYC